MYHSSPESSLSLQLCSNLRADLQGHLNSTETKCLVLQQPDLQWQQHWHLEQYLCLYMERSIFPKVPTSSEVTDNGKQHCGLPLNCMQITKHDLLFKIKMVLYLYGKNSTAESIPSATQISHSVAQSQNTALEGIPTYNKNHINVTNHSSCLTYQEFNVFYLKPLNKTACLHIFH